MMRVRNEIITYPNEVGKKIDCVVKKKSKK